jgi:hypothetical protein
MLVTSSKSVRTVNSATAVANHRKLRRRENAGRSNHIASHQCSHSVTECLFTVWLLTKNYSIYMLYL